ncbi:sugar ABC transporter ATP-binding protein [Virgibacillus sp. CBA3643]|uniref:sugar ABC transporter ATP-binding protein n=1 Tax=Virgibacillus sp. CBA3643 TaxID=2942278 RepID=UPI0035A2C8B4
MDYSNNSIEMKGITKTFPGVKALDNVNLAVKNGTVHALMGENGAGKSTLMKILAGIYKPDSGEIILDGAQVSFREPNDALESGISMIHQELSPIREMSIAENIYLGREPCKPLSRFVDFKELYKQTTQLLNKVGVNFNPREKIKNLSVAEMQMVEIAKAISYDSKIIIMDEPTSAITDKEVERLFKLIEVLKQQDKGIIYISHKMDEIFEITDEITVFRDGSYIGTEITNETNKDALIQMMVGRKLTNLFPKETQKIDSTKLLEINNLSEEGIFKNISFSLKKGEVLGITGLMGSGRSEVVEAIFGLRKLDEGEISIEGKSVDIRSPIDAIKNNIAFVTEDRKEEGLFLPMSIKENISISSLESFVKGGFIIEGKVNKIAKESIDSLNIKAYSHRQTVKTLSGGNQQKVVLAKWLLTKPKILILDEPTRGIDVGAKIEIYKLMNELVKEGFSIIMISSEMPEVLNMCDRILVFHEGKISGELNRDEATQEKILQYATGNANINGGIGIDGKYATNKNS